eukprot:765634-Hanusia_phi.AAC.4
MEVVKVRRASRRPKLREAGEAEQAGSLAMETRHGTMTDGGEGRGREGTEREEREGEEREREDFKRLSSGGGRRYDRKNGFRGGREGERGEGDEGDRSMLG